MLLEPFGGASIEEVEPLDSAQSDNEAVPAPQDDAETAESLAAEAGEALASRKWEKAEKLYRKALQKDPLSTEFKTGQQQALLELKNAQELSDGLRFLEGNLYGDAMKSLRKVTKESVYRQEANLRIE